MPRSGQIYHVLTKDMNQIYDALKTIQTTDTKKFPHMIKLDNSKKNIISGIVDVRYFDGTFPTHDNLYFEFNISKSYCYIIGKGDARNSIINEFDKLIESDDKVKVIQNFKLNGKCIYVDMLKILTDIDKEHFIQNLKAKFGLEGFSTPLDKHKVMEIEYRFIKNICVSKHKKSEQYADKAIFCKIKFGV